MKRALGRLSLLSALILTALPASAERVWSVEVITGETAPELVLPDLAKRWAARIEQRDDGKSLLVGTWQDQAEAQRALADIKKRFPLSFVRSAELVTDPRAQRAVPVTGGIIAFRESNRGLAETRAVPGQAARVERDPDPWASRIKRESTKDAAGTLAGAKAQAAGKDASTAGVSTDPALTSPASGPRARAPATRSQAMPAMAAARPAGGPNSARSKPALIGAGSVQAGHAGAIRLVLTTEMGEATLAALRRKAHAGVETGVARLDDVLPAEVRRRFTSALQQGARTVVARLVDAHPELTTCSDPASAWAAADMISEGDTLPLASAVMSRMLDCGDANIRLATLEKSFTWQAPGVWRQWLSREQARSLARDATGLPKRLDDLLYRDQVRQLVALASADDTARTSGTPPVPAQPDALALATELLSALGARVERRKDAGVATLLGWVHLRGALDLSATDVARRWFTRAQEWAPDSAEADEGLIRIALVQGRADEAWRAAQRYRGDESKRRQLSQEAALALGAAAYSRQSFGEALDWLRRAEGLAALPQYAERQIAWTLLASGQAEDAAQRFADSYRSAPDEEAARGVVASYKALGRLDAAKALPSSEPLARLLAREAGERALSSKLFQAAARLQGAWMPDPDTLAEAARQAQTHSATWAPYTRRKTGTEGASRLGVRDANSIGVALPVLKLSAWLEARLDRFTLDAGQTPGTVDATPASLEQATLLLRRESAQSWWEAEVGRMSQRVSAGSLPARTHARLAAGWDTPDSSLTLALSRQPVRESQLSWAGIQEAGAARGAVLRERLSVEARRALGRHWSVGGHWREDVLSGTGVAGNRQRHLAAQVGYDLGLSGFDYAVLAMAASSLRSERNLSYFTPGHGGYFSPAWQWRVGPTLDFMTREADTWMMKGRLAWGRTGKLEAEAPVLALAADGRFNPAVRERAAAWEVEVGIVKQLLPHLQAGFWVSRRHASEYDDRAYLLTIRILDKPRSKVLSRDLPQLQAGSWL